MALDLVGNRYTRLLVLRATGTSHRTFREWECLCDCGTVCVKTTNALRTQNTKSCGCALSNPISPKKVKLIPIERLLYNMYCSEYRTNARKRGLEWSLSREQVQRLSKEDCHYCGSPPSRVFTTSKREGSMVVSGIDRVDNDVGYTESNCVAACAPCNRSKMALTADQFRDWMSRTSSHMNLQYNG